MKSKILSILVFSILSSEFFSCSSGTGSDNPIQLIALAARAARVIADSRNNVVLQGTVNGPGAIQNATVQVYPTPTNGQCAKDDGTINGTSIASTTSDEFGNYSLKYKKTGSTVCVVVTPTGTSQIQVFSPATRTNIPTSWSKGNLMAVINEPAPTNAGFTPANKTVNVNPFTRMTARRFSALSAINPPTRSRVFLRVRPYAVRALTNDKNQKVEFGNNTASTLLDKAGEDVENAFFPNRDKKTFSLESADPNNNTMKLRLGTIGLKADKLGGSADGKVSSDDLEKVINFMEEDFSDGRFDGKKVDDSTGKITTMTTTDFGGVVASKQAADDFLKVDFKAAQAEYDSYDSSLASAASDQLFCETDSLDAACSIAILPGSPPEIWIFDDNEDFIDLDGVSDFGAVGKAGLGGSTKTWYFTIVNGGGLDLKLTTPITIAGTEFTIFEQPEAVIAPGDAAYLGIEFAPPAASTYTRTITILSNDTLYTPYNITLTGTGQDLTSNFALWWSFDAGDASDDTANARDGVLYDSAMYFEEDFYGVPEGAAYFDITTPDKITASGTAMSFGNTFTFSAWVSPDDFDSGTGKYTIFSRGGSNPDIALTFLANGTILRFTTRTTGTVNLDYPIDPDDYLNYWTHIAAVYDGPNSKMKLFIDGVQVSTTATQTGSLAGATNFMLGERNLTDNFSGTLDEVRVYIRALTAAQISALVNQD